MSEYLFINTNNDLLRIASESIVYITADGNYSRITVSNGDERMVVQQLGTIERLIKEQLRHSGVNFIRLGRSLIINHEFIYYINLSHQQLELADGRQRYATLTASREALRQLKEVIEKQRL
ncbi:MAG: LytTR family transcriptional regulator DNA-binding domain-containing protein [Bacteroidales bacterium]|nr:LytTR family transcriptional regulator DNA-binding domain-containing protein [Bacteroidales bacterium]